MLQDILTAVEPFVMEAIVALVGAALYPLLRGRVDQDSLHCALESGALAAREMLADGKITADEVLDQIIGHAEISTPGAIKRLKPGGETLRNLARSKAAKVKANG